MPVFCQVDFELFIRSIRYDFSDGSEEHIVDSMKEKQDTTFILYSFRKFDLTRNNPKYNTLFKLYTNTLFQLTMH